MNFEMPWKKKKSKLEEEREAIIGLMHERNTVDDDYMYLVKVVEELDAAIERERSRKKVLKIDPNTFLVVIGSIGEIILMMNHERLYSFTSKAFGRIIRPRI